MQVVVGVKFNPSGKIYYFDPNNLELKINDKCVVDSNFGTSLGIVSTEKMKIDETKLPEELKNVVRKATEQDIKKFEELKKRADKDLVVIKQNVKKLNLEMKIVSANYSLDESKIIIEFSAEERVDFRDLLKELASALKVRIELRQVGQRDEVKLKGGIGPCGEICCCTRFLNDFEHVTIKMAKNQGLSLSPTKINGLCGRLMCCLGYENQNYEEVLSRMPKINSIIKSPKGEGTVIYNDILRERVSIKISNGDESSVVYDFALDELDYKPRQENNNQNKNFKPNKFNNKK